MTEGSIINKLRRGLSSVPVIFVFVVIFASIGAYLLFKGHAATPFVSQEAETGTIGAPATVITDSTASGGKAIQFNAPSTSTGAFMSYPLQTAKMSVSGGSNVEISNKSFKGIAGSPAITISKVNNVYIHDVDFDSNSGDIYLVDVTGQVRIENIRSRNNGAGATTIGSGLRNVIQLSRTYDNGTGGIRHIKIYGGQTEDVISVFQSGGIDATHPLVIEDVHEEHPLPPDPLAWTSNSGTCINLTDAGGHDIILRNSTFLNCAAVGIQMNNPNRVTVTNNIVFGAQRATSNVGLSQYGTCSTTCSGDRLSNNRVWWKNSSGSPNAKSIQHPEYFTINPTIAPYDGNVYQDTTIDPNSLKVVL